MTLIENGSLTELKRHLSDSILRHVNDEFITIYNNDLQKYFF